MSFAVAELPPIQSRVNGNDGFCIPDSELYTPSETLNSKRPQSVHALLSRIPYEPGQPSRIVLTVEEIEQLRSGFKATGGIPHNNIEPAGIIVFNSEDQRKTITASTYTEFSTVNGLRWGLDFKTLNAPYYPIAKNFKGGNLSQFDLSELYYELYYMQLSNRKILRDHEYQHALIEHLVDENIADFLQLSSGETIQEEEEIFIFKEPLLDNCHCPDRVYVWPRVGIFPLDVFQGKERKRGESGKYKQFKVHVDSAIKLFRDLYGDTANLNIIPILIKFNIDEEIKKLSIRPFLHPELLVEPQEVAVA